MNIVIAKKQESEEIPPTPMPTCGTPLYQERKGFMTSKEQVEILGSKELQELQERL
jgi:hypothetical protein